MRTWFAKPQPVCAVGLPAPFRIMERGGWLCEPRVSGQDCPLDGKRGRSSLEPPARIPQAGRTRLWWRGERSKTACFFRFSFFLIFSPSILPPYVKFGVCCVCFLFCALKLANEFGTVSPTPLGYYPFPSEAAITLNSPGWFVFLGKRGKLKWKVKMFISPYYSKPLCHFSPASQSEGKKNKNKNK